MRFAAGIDYGARKGTLGFVVHMAEGGDGTVAYLARRSGESDSAWRTRVRGVSANFVILSTGETVQMVRWDRASGSLNPADRGPTSGFYRTSIIQAVLGPRYVDPNAWSLSVEITGYRKVGPNRDQVEALVALVAEARRRYPTLRGAYGHADQTDTKGDPGVAPSMLEAWQRIGHGLFAEEVIVKVFSVPGSFSGSWPVGTPVYPGPTGAASGKLATKRAGLLVVGQDKAINPTRYLVDGAGDSPSAGMAWLPVEGMTAKRDETFNAGVAAAAKAAAAAKR